MKVKRILYLLTIMALALGMTVCAFSSSARSDDPADSYVKRVAENEDESLTMWFDHSFRKTFTSDTTSTGMDTYSVYMAKNEIESAQVVLYSETDKTNMDIAVTDFTDGKGNTVSAELYYQMYVTTENLATDGVYSMTAEDSIIREGETPDPIMPYSALATAKKPASFKLNGGKSQAFLIRATTKSDTASGWYSAELSVYNSAKERVKVATVYLYVWNFEIPDEIDFQTSIFVGNDNRYGGSYTDFYDYLLENRICAMDVPGGTLTSDNPYLLNPRVNAIRVSSTGLGSVSKDTYMEASPGTYAAYADMYNDLSTSPAWELFKDKLYFYTADEFTSDEHQDDCAYGDPTKKGHTADTVTTNYAAVERYWENPNVMVTIHHDTPYPYYTYHKPLSQYADYEKQDNIQHVLDTNTAQIWCPQLYSYTPREDLVKTGYTLDGKGNGILRDLNKSISGTYSLYDSYNGHSNWGYYDWDALYGTFADRLNSYRAMKAEQGEDITMWTYRAGGERIYAYCNHLIENTGLQTKMLFWQCYQEDITGYLYYASNDWAASTNPYIDSTVTGAKSTCKWYTNKYTYNAGKSDACSIYGMGVLFYGKNMGRTNGVDVVGTLRVECMRDGIEEYTMLKMLESYKGKDRAQEIVSRVSENVVTYLSLNNFSTSQWASDMDEYDIMACVRRELGNELEASTEAGLCEHKWNNGEITQEAACLVPGTKLYTCTLCGAERSEVIPALHTSGEVFECESSTEATCTTKGSAIMKCTVCGYRKTVETPAFHDDSTKYVYTYKTDEAHTVSCSVCNKVINSAEKHVVVDRVKTVTCTENGYEKKVCRYCDHEEVISETVSSGHDFQNGVCTVCGEKEASEGTLGDLDGDGKLNSKDSNILTRIVAGLDADNPLADINSDGKINAVDSSELVAIISGAQTEMN